MAVKLYITGWAVLIGAILLNAAIVPLGLTGWYEFLSRLQGEGRKYLSTLRVVDWLWLLFAYPLLLGLCARIGMSLHARLPG